MSMSTLISTHREDILGRWRLSTARARFAAGLSPVELDGAMPRYLASLGRGNRGIPVTLSFEQQRLIEQHLADRIQQGSTLNEILTEFANLAHCISVAIDPGPREERPPWSTARVLSELNMGCLAATRIFNEHLLEDEQTEKLFIRQLQAIAAEPIRDHGDRQLRATLDRAVTVVTTAMAAHTGALLVFDRHSGQLIMTASSGDAFEHLEHYASAGAIGTLAAAVASQQEPTRIVDVAVTELDVSDALRRSGIHSVLGIRLSSHGSLQGVLYVGVREKRDFSASDLRRLQNLGVAIGHHLHTLQTIWALDARAQRLDAESHVQRRFVAMLVHDLRAPLRAARAAASAPHADIDAVAENLDHLERMIDDLSDAHHVSVGHQLPMIVEECDLGLIARETVKELSACHGARFAIRVERAVRGVWSPDKLRRAIWNLATNAIRFGSSEGVVTISVARHPDGAVVAVHNEGPPIPDVDQRDLFAPFATPRSGRGKPAGWGLGLTLVWSCAEAHGGRVAVSSLAAAGTTFELILPWDARPYLD